MNRSKLLERQKFRCIYCHELYGTLVEWDGKKRFLKAEADHIIPRSYSQDSSEKNYAMACDCCNGMKSDNIFWGRTRQIRKWLNQQRKKHTIRFLFTPTISNEESLTFWALEYTRYLKGYPQDERYTTNFPEVSISLNEEVDIYLKQNFLCALCDVYLLDNSPVLYYKWKTMYLICRPCRYLVHDYLFTMGIKEARYFIEIVRRR